MRGRSSPYSTDAPGVGGHRTFESHELVLEVADIGVVGSGGNEYSGD